MYVKWVEKSRGMHSILWSYSYDQSPILKPFGKKTFLLLADEY